jgi:uncharacterized DUF497 family protein
MVVRFAKLGAHIISARAATRNERRQYEQGTLQ